MKHPDVDESIFGNFVYRICDLMDPILNFFNKFYITTDEGFNMIPLKDNNPELTGVNGHIEIYTADHDLPKYIKTPIVRIVYDNNKWSHYTSDYNHTIAVTIDEKPKQLQKHKFREGELTEEQFKRFLEFISYNRDNLLKLWYEGYKNHREINFSDCDPNHVFDWHLYRYKK